MLIEPESLVTGFRLLPLSMAGMTLPLLAEVPGKVVALVDPPKRPATFAPDASPVVSLVVVIVFVGVTQLIPLYYWRKYVRIRGRVRTGDTARDGEQWQSPLQETDTDSSDTATSSPAADERLFDRRLTLGTEVALALVAYIMPAMLLTLALVLGSP